MSDWISIALLLMTYAAMVGIIAHTCASQPLLAKHQQLLLALSIVWAVATTFNLILVSDESMAYDGTSHERNAREVTDQLNDGRFEGYRIFLGNELYRVLLGHFYYVTRVDSRFIYGLNCLLGFTGMMFSILATAKGIRATSIPRWFVGLGMCLPSTLLWCPLNLKEGSIMFCLGIVLLTFSGLPNSLNTFSRLVPFSLASLYLFLIRPHIAAAWIGGMTLGRLRQRQGGVKAFLAAGLFLTCSVAAVFAVEMIKPGFLGSVSEEGIHGSMQAGYESRKYTGETAMYDQAAPKPFITGMLIILLSPPPQFWGHPVWLVMGMESLAITLTLLYGFMSSGRQVRLNLMNPFYFGAVYVFLLMSFFLSYSYNMGLAIRQRMQVIPAALVLIGTPLLPIASVGPKTAPTPPVAS